MIKKQRCPKCGKLVDALYSPDWVCLNCVSKDVLNMYPAMKAKVRENKEKGKHA